MNELGDMTKTASRKATVWGILVVILGALAIGTPFVTGVAITISLGVILLATGVAQILFCFQSDSFGTGVLRFMFGLLAGLCGLSLVMQPAAGLASITLFLAIWFFVDGVFAIVHGIGRGAEAGRVWMILNGVISIVLGIMIYNRFPVSAVWLVGLLVGIRLMMAGFTMIALGSAGREVSKRLSEAAEE